MKVHDLHDNSEMIAVLISKVPTDWWVKKIVQLLFDFQLWRSPYSMCSAILYMIYIFQSTFTYISLNLLNNSVLMTEHLPTQMWSKYLMWSMCVLKYREYVKHLSNPLAQHFAQMAVATSCATDITFHKVTHLSCAAHPLLSAPGFSVHWDSRLWWVMCKL